MAKTGKIFSAKYTDPALATGVNEGHEFTASDALAADDLNKIVNNQKFLNQEIGDKFRILKSVTKWEVGYQTSTSGSVKPTGTWTPNILQIEKGKYLWTRVILTLSDESKIEYCSVAYQGQDGNNATPWVAITNLRGGEPTIYYHPSNGNYAVNGSVWIDSYGYHNVFVYGPVNWRYVTQLGAYDSSPRY